MIEKKLVVLKANGWTLYAHPAFLEQLTTLTQHVVVLKQKDPENYRQKKAAKRLAAIKDLILEIIPGDPMRADYRQGDTLGEQNKHWFRTKFFQQYRLFFRFNEEHKVIVFCWVNDDETKRAYDSKTDAYKVFAKMLASGHPPDDWDTLLSEASAVTEQFAVSVEALPRKR
jgi:toxin YhaV